MLRDRDAYSREPSAPCCWSMERTSSPRQEARFEDALSYTKVLQAAEAIPGLAILIGDSGLTQSPREYLTSSISRLLACRPVRSKGVMPRPAAYLVLLFLDARFIASRAVESSSCL
jgi:hypothetical protein